ncbi:hypothetical protein [Halalkalicoccus sp. NIPERK01]|uniref:hypothetical protein n=1 Tax=Halalkalicoccus sp. NIPERK01 TaxID=3053469 RepID=UPI00256F0337|nr:hypothetical protein [Halalkalicoccus sp. NIPERK01]MDL5363161.1 hypothetical protein [Halalkalicoccus sp. NIPERK01]
MIEEYGIAITCVRTEACVDDSRMLLNSQQELSIPKAEELGSSTGEPRGAASSVIARQRQFDRFKANTASGGIHAIFAFGDHLEIPTPTGSFSPYHWGPPPMADHPRTSVLLSVTRWTDVCRELAAQPGDHDDLVKQDLIEKSEQTSTNSPMRATTSSLESSIGVSRNSYPATIEHALSKLSLSSLAHEPCKVGNPVVRK